MEQVYDMYIYTEMSSQDILKKMWNTWGWINDDRLLNSSWAVALRAHLKKCIWWGSSSLDGLSVLNTSPLGEACKHAPDGLQTKGSSSTLCLLLFDIMTWQQRSKDHSYCSVVVMPPSSAVLQNHIQIVVCSRLVGFEESGMLLRRKWLHCWELEARNDSKVWLERRGLAWGWCDSVGQTFLSESVSDCLRVYFGTVSLF